MKICTIGGTNFSGRAFTGSRSRRDTRSRCSIGDAGDDPWPDAEHVHGDREGGLDALVGPVLRRDRRLLRLRAAADRARPPRRSPDGRYVFISSVSAHRRTGAPARPRSTTSTSRPSPTRRRSPGRPTVRSRWRASTRSARRAATAPRSCARTTSSGRTTRPTDSRTGCAGPPPAGACSRPRRPTNRCSGSTPATSRRSSCTSATTTSRARSTSRSRRERHTLGELIETSAEAAGSAVEVAWCDEPFVAANELLVTEEQRPVPADHAR